MDVTITACRRPALLARTLESFSRNLFAQIPANTVYVNIDPVWGDDIADAGVEAICRAYFSDVIIRRPETPSFGAAVKWLWAQPQTEWFLHLEDDWTLTSRISPERLETEMTGGVSQIRLENWSRWIRRKRPPSLCTGPSFILRDYGSHVSSLMNPALDPEKQLNSPRNPFLAAYTAPCRARYHGHALSPRFAIDIGREWRERRKITKSIIDGASLWSEQQAHS